MSDIVLPVGFRYGVVYKLNANGTPAATGLTAYGGIEFAGPKAFNITVPQARVVSHQGKDRVIMSDQLPTLETTVGEIRVSSLDYDLEALLTNVVKFTVGDSTGVPRSTDQQGAEPEVGLLLYQQAKDRVTGLRRWHYYIVPATRCLPIPASWGENPEDHRYSINPSQTTKHLWGTALVVGTEGATEQAIVDLHSAYQPRLEAFLADGVEDEFTLLNTAANNTYSVWVNDVLRTANITKTTTAFTFTSAVPASDARIVVLYGKA